MVSRRILSESGEAAMLIFHVVKSPSWPCIWFNLLERAFALHRIKLQPSSVPVTGEVMDSVGFRRGGTDVMDILTGHKSKVVNLAAKTRRPADPLMLKQVRSEVQAAIRDHRIMETQKDSHAFCRRWLPCGFGYCHAS